MSIIVSVKHDVGDLSEYTSTVTDSGDLSVSTAAALANTRQGLSLLIDDATAIYGQVDFTRLTSKAYRFRFYLDPNSLTMADSEGFEIISVEDGTVDVTRVELRRNSGEYRLRLEQTNDADTFANLLSPIELTDAPHYVEIDVQWATTASASDGVATLYVDGVEHIQLTGIDLFDHTQPDRVRIGAIAGIDAGTSGTFYLDEFILRNDNSEIGEHGRTFIEAELAGSGNGYTDLTPHVVQSSGVSIEYGMPDGGPLTRIASVGSMQWNMNNLPSGEDYGYYTPGHTNARSGWELGIKVRCWIGGLVKHVGSLVEINPDAGRYGRRQVICISHDWMDDAISCLFQNNSVLANKRSDEIVKAVVDNCPRRKPEATDYEQGQSTFAYAFDNLRDEGDTAYRALADVTKAEAGFTYVKGDGTLKFEDRQFRSSSVTAEATFNETMFQVEAIRTREDIYNRIIMVAHPRKDSASVEVVYELTPTESVPSLAPGESIALQGFFRSTSGRFVRIGADSVVTPVATTDYLGNSQADGLGSDLTSDLGISFVSTSNSGTTTFTNNHVSSTIHITKYQIRAETIEDRYETSVTVEDTASQDKFGEHDLRYDLIFEDNLNIAQGLADWFLFLYGDSADPTVVQAKEIVFNGAIGSAVMHDVLLAEPGSRIMFTEFMTGIDNLEYFVNGVRLSIGPSGFVNNATLILAPSAGAALEIWELGIAGLGELDSKTFLGFA